LEMMAQGSSWTMVLPISASQVSGIRGMRPWCMACLWNFKILGAGFAVLWWSICHTCEALGSDLHQIF
jgi:hypothetical protein